MTTDTRPRLSAARRARPALLLATAVLLAAGCAAGGQGTAGTSSSPSASPSWAAASPTAPALTVAPTPTPALARTPAPATSTPEAGSAGSTASDSPSASATSTTFASPFYRYRLTFPPAWVPGPAHEAWDGSARIDSDGPYVDRAYGPGSKLFFVYGAPTKADLGAYAARGQQDVNTWHGCPATTESTTDVTIGGVPGRLHGFHCQGLYVMKAFAVRDGFGWAFNQIGPPGAEAADTAAFEAMLAEVGWAE